MQSWLQHLATRSNALRTAHPALLHIPVHMTPGQQSSWPRICHATASMQPDATGTDCSTHVRMQDLTSAAARSRGLHKTRLSLHRLPPSPCWQRHPKGCCLGRCQN